MYLDLDLDLDLSIYLSIYLYMKPDTGYLHVHVNNQVLYFSCAFLTQTYIMST